MNLDKDKTNTVIEYVIKPTYPIFINKSRNYDKTKDSNYRNPIYYPKRKKHGKR